MPIVLDINSAKINIINIYKLENDRENFELLELI